MALTKQEYDERKARVGQGTADDEDHRLVRQYEREEQREGGERSSHGNSSETSGSETLTTLEKGEADHPSTAPMTESSSKSDPAVSSTARSTAGSGKAGTAGTQAKKA